MLKDYIPVVLEEGASDAVLIGFELEGKVASLYEVNIYGSLITIYQGSVRLNYEAAYSSKWTETLKFISALKLTELASEHFLVNYSSEIDNTKVDGVSKSHYISYLLLKSIATKLEEVNYV